MQGRSYNNKYHSSGHNHTDGNNLQSLRLSPPEYEAATKHMKDRFLYTLANSLGCKITVTTDSDIIEGILYSISEINDSIPSLIIKFPTNKAKIYDSELLKIPHSAIQMISCENVDLSPKISAFSKSSKSASTSASESPTTTHVETPAPASASASTNRLATAKTQQQSPPSSSNSTPTLSTASMIKKSFKIDSDISAIGTSEKRELKRWTPDANVSLPNLDGGLEAGSSGSGNWDQFEVNKTKFGVEAQFDENEYTVKLDTSNPEFEERMRFAKAVEKEIISQSSNGNLHIAEERGEVIDLENIDEEDKYSGVLRDNKESERKIMMMLKTDSKPQEKESESRLVSPPETNKTKLSDDIKVKTKTRSKAKQTEAELEPMSKATSPSAAPVVMSTPPTSVLLPEKPKLADAKKILPKPEKEAPALSSLSASPSSTAKPTTTPEVSPELNKTNVASPKPGTSATSTALAASQSPVITKTSHIKSKFGAAQKMAPEFSPQNLNHASTHPQHQQRQNIPHYPLQDPNYRPQTRTHQSQHQFNNQYQPRNNTNNNNYNNNYNHQNFNQKTKRPSFKLANGPREKPNTGSVLNGKFNILHTAKKEYLTKNNNEKDKKVKIIPMNPSFIAAPAWPETTSLSYSEKYAKENPVQPVNMGMPPQMYMSQNNFQPQRYPMQMQPVMVPSFMFVRGGYINTPMQPTYPPNNGYNNGYGYQNGYQ